jgi:hypothetical protein
MPGPNDPYKYDPSKNPLDPNHSFWQGVRDAAASPTASNIGAAIGTVLLPGPTSFFRSGGFSNVPGLDFVLNPGKYPSSASLLNPTGWNTYASRTQKEQAGTWKNEPYRYQAGDDPVQIAAQNNITPAQLLEANPGGYPFATGQNINLPTWKEAPASTAPATVTPQQINPAQPYGGFTPAKADNTDYANTAAARYYDAAGTPFLQQKRWDPQAKKYVSLGKLMKQGKLDLQGNWNKQSRRQRQAANQQPQQQQAAQDNTLTNSLIKFSVSSG